LVLILFCLTRRTRNFCEQLDNDFFAEQSDRFFSPQKKEKRNFFSKTIMDDGPIYQISFFGSRWNRKEAKSLRDKLKKEYGCSAQILISGSNC
jgi:hypothetical protein